MACGTCPDAVTQTLRRKVRAESDKLAAIIDATSFFNDAFRSITGSAVNSVGSAVNAIPSPSPLDFFDLLAYVTCPLTPLALAVDDISELTSLDPEAQMKRVRSLGSGDIANARRVYENALRTSPDAAVISQARRYEQKLRRLQFSATSFAEAMVISATVFTTCGQEEFEEGGFNTFVQLAQGFSFTGGVPSTLDQNLAALTQRLSIGEAKFKALRATLS